VRFPETAAASDTSTSAESAVPLSEELPPEDVLESEVLSPPHPARQDAVIIRLNVIARIFFFIYLSILPNPSLF
jgi:hypothetical protein